MLACLELQGDLTALLKELTKSTALLHLSVRPSFRLPPSIFHGSLLKEYKPNQNNITAPRRRRKTQALGWRLQTTDHGPDRFQQAIVTLN